LLAQGVGGSVGPALIGQAGGEKKPIVDELASIMV